MSNAQRTIQQSIGALIAFAICFATPTARAEVRKSTPMLCGSISSSNIAPMQLSAAELRELSAREIVLIVDKSSSMSCKDCPPAAVPTDSSMTAFERIAAAIAKPISRWEWCFSQIGGLVEQLHSVSQDGLTVVMFDSKCSENYCRTADVVRLFEHVHPGGRTELAPALSSQIASHIAKRWGALPVKPLLMAVLTDGYASDANEVRRIIVDATRSVKLHDDIQILFVNVGHQECGSQFLKELDEQLLSDGAKFDMVHSIKFTDVAKEGLGKRLAKIAMESRPL